MKWLKEIKRLWVEVLLQYPVDIKRLLYFHTGTAMNMLVAMMKPLIPEPLRSNIKTGCVFEQRLDRLYLVPTLEASNQRLLNRVAETLQRRFDNERNFRLHDDVNT
jgi:hypothetical protein